MFYINFSRFDLNYGRNVRYTIRKIFRNAKNIIINFCSDGDQACFNGLFYIDVIEITYVIGDEKVSLNGQKLLVLPVNYLKKH